MLRRAMVDERVLVCWTGFTDLRCSRGEDSGIGPVAQALTKRQFQRAVLLSNAKERELKPYLRWLGPQTKARLEVRRVTLGSPMDFREVYRCSVEALESITSGATRDRTRLARAPSPKLTFNISPGTPVMAAVWIILANTRFPAEVVATAPERGVYEVAVPFDISAEYIGDLLSAPDAALRQESRAPAPEHAVFAEIVGESRVMREVKRRAAKVAPRTAPVLLLGESGTGKELFARAIHSASLRKGKPFVAVNCGAIPKNLVESELFGHKRGAFTGAAIDRTGHFRDANGGTLFLDELGELPLDTQVKLLRVLETGEVMPIGESRTCAVDVRIIAATNRDLAGHVQAGEFREDLFYRLAVAVLQLPPLRDREGDLGIIIGRLLERVNDAGAAQPGFQRKKLAAGAKAVLLHHSWPGNVRELYNTLLRAAIWSDGETIGKAEMREALLTAPAPHSTPILQRPLGDGFSLDELLDEVSRHYIIQAIEQSGGQKTKAAELVGLRSHQTLTNRMKRLELER